MRLSSAVLITVLLLCRVGAGADWPDWRGPTQDGRTEATALPLHWSESENVTWKTAIHDLGHSTPVTWKDQIWLTTAKTDGTAFYALCLDLASGKIVHDLPVFEARDPQHINPNNSYATPSATIESGRVYVHFGTFGTACIDTASGKILWRRTDLNCDHMQGPGSSPILFEDLLILTIEGTDKQFMVALNKKTGETVWTYNRPEDLYKGIKGVYVKSYQTPIVVKVGGKPQLVSNGAVMATGHNPRTGEELWRVRYRDDSTISRIVTGHGLLFVNTGGPPGGTELWAIREGGVGDVTETHPVWKMTKDAPHESSPVLVGDLLFTMSDRSALICTEAVSGKQVWSERLKGDYWSSLLASRDRIYACSKKGGAIVFAPGREYHELAANNLDGEFLASPAVAGNALLLRTKTHLYRIEEKK